MVIIRVKLDNGNVAIESVINLNIVVDEAIILVSISLDWRIIDSIVVSLFESTTSFGIISLELMDRNFRLQ